VKLEFKLTDRELIEMAAKAAGMVLLSRLKSDPEKCLWWEEGKPNPPFQWNPLEDDGDALRLAVKRNIFICNMDVFRRFYDAGIANGRDETEATRRAIVRAAAEIGRKL